MMLSSGSWRSTEAATPTAAENNSEEATMNGREHLSRRHFLARLAIAGVASVLAPTAADAMAQQPPETTRIRIARVPALCTAPAYVAEALLGLEGFADVQYIDVGEVAAYDALAQGRVDFSAYNGAHAPLRLDAGDPIVVLAGLHPGCYQLFGTDRVRAIRDLRGKRVAVPERPSSSAYLLVSSMAAYVGLSPGTDISWVMEPAEKSIKLLAEGTIDAFMAYPPLVQELQAKRIGRVVVDTATDRPWSQYFCCMVAANQSYVRQHPIATKRALRAILKAADVCAVDAPRAAQVLVKKGYAAPDYALKSIMDVRYDRWRAFNPEDTVRFFALRLHEAGTIKTSPHKLIAKGTDWRFLNELKQELKG
jgi:NitT/TauT family transport system substrate-binding protein